MAGAFRALKARGLKGMWSTRFIVGFAGWLLTAGLLIILWSMTTAGDSDPVITDESAQSSWQRISTFLLPHATWLIFLASFSIFFIRYISGQLTTLWRGSPTLHRPYTMTVTDDGLTFVEPLARHDLKWFAFDRVIETRNLFLLYITEHSFHMVPKRGFVNAGELDEFRATIDNRITRRGAAFPVLPVAG
jgi:hypothetical protein